MDKRTFIKTSSTLMAGTFLSGIAGCKGGKEQLTNWAGNLEYSAGQVHYPENIEELQEIIQRFTKLRPLGSRHSFNTIADSRENLVSSQNLNKIISLDKSNHTVTVGAGIKYGELVQYLND